MQIMDLEIRTYFMMVKSDHQQDHTVFQIYLTIINCGGLFLLIWSGYLGFLFGHCIIA